MYATRYCKTQKTKIKLEEKKKTRLSRESTMLAFDEDGAVAVYEQWAFDWLV